MKEKCGSVKPSASEVADYSSDTIFANENGFQALQIKEKDGRVHKVMLYEWQAKTLAKFIKSNRISYVTVYVLN